MPSYTKERVAVMLFARSMELAAHTSPTIRIMAQDPATAWERALSPAERSEWTAMVDEIDAKCSLDEIPREAGLCGVQP